MVLLVPNRACIRLDIEEEAGGDEIRICRI